jgi:hypothetical protein
MFDRLGWSAAEDRPVHGIEEKAKLVAADLMQKSTPPTLSPEQEAAIDQVVAEAWRKRQELGHV